MASAGQGMRVLMACQEPCWLCEEYEEPSVEGIAIGTCYRPREPLHVRHICGACVREIYGARDVEEARERVG